MFFKIINKIKIGLKYNKKMIRTKINKNDFNLIKIFLKLNILKIVKKNNYNIFDIFINNKYLLKNIKNLYKPSSKKFICYKELKKLTTKKKWLLILSTNKGLITNLDAIKKKTSGILLIKLSF
jgi:ribosomal protein S8